MKSNKSSYEEERAFQAHQAANDILVAVNQNYSGSSPGDNYTPRSGPGSITYNETDYLISVKSSASGITTRSVSENYLYIPGAAGNYITDDIIPERRSSARRLFSICCVFDFLLTCILWTIIAINHYGGLTNAYDKSIKHFSYNTSMADLLLLSLGRSTVLVLQYWVIVSQMQVTVIITTTVSTAYIFVKLVLFARSTDWNNFETYVLLLISFLLCWVEVWLFETKVLKKENQITRILRPRYPNETSPLIGRPYATSGSDYNYSAFVTPSATIPPTPGGDRHYEEATLDHRGQMMYGVGLEAHAELKETVMWPDGWTTESDKEGIKVFSRAQRKAPNRLFLSESHFLCSLEDLFDVLYTQMDRVTDWNAGIVQVEMVERLTDHLDILYTIGVGGGGGLIKSREFLTLRYWLKERDMYYIVSRDIHDPVKPVSGKYPRGFNGPCGYVFFPALDGSVKLAYVVNVDLKLPLVPQKIINSNLTEVVHDFHMALRCRVDDYLDAKRKSLSQSNLG